MKKQIILKSILAILVLSIGVSTSSCKKEQSAAEIQTKRISDIIPQKYLDSLISLGVTIHEGTTTIQGLDLLGRKVLGDNGAKLRRRYYWKYIRRCESETDRPKQFYFRNNIIWEKAVRRQ